MVAQTITKSLVDRLEPRAKEYAVWDAKLPSFGIRVRPSGAKSFIVVYRAGTGRKAPVRRYTIGNTRQITPNNARMKAQKILGDVAHGLDPAANKAEERDRELVTTVADLFMEKHVRAKRKASTYAMYQDLVERFIKPHFGNTKIDKLNAPAISKLHASMVETPYQANRIIEVLCSMYTFAALEHLAPKGYSPAKDIVKYKEQKREVFLTMAEIERVGAAIREAETMGIPWDVDESGPAAKHLARKEKRLTKLDPFAGAALRLLIFTGCRLREILHLKWDYIDWERGMLFLPDSKSGQRPVVLNAAALLILANTPRVTDYVIPGTKTGQPRADLKRPWLAIKRRAGLTGKRIRVHDLRHTFASVGVGGGMGLPIVGKLLGHLNPSTTARYAHLEIDPVRRATDQIGSRIADAMGDNPRLALPPPTPQ